MKNTAIFISSTPKYSFIWDTFFTLLRNNWENCPYPIYFISTGDTEYLTEKYNINIEKIEKDLGFLESYRYLCQKYKEKYSHFILLQEDYLIEKKVNQKTLDEYEKILFEKENIGFIRTMPCPGPKGEKRRFGDIELRKINKNEDYSFCFQSSFWNLEYFFDFTKIPKNSPSGSENFLAKKMRRCRKKENWGFIRPFKESHAVYESPIPYRPTAIVKGKLQGWAKKLIIPKDKC